MWLKKIISRYVSREKYRDISRHRWIVPPLLLLDTSVRSQALEFISVQPDKSNMLMTAQELESMPDQGLEFEASVGPKHDRDPSATPLGPAGAAADDPAGKHGLGKRNRLVKLPLILPCCESCFVFRRLQRKTFALSNSLSYVDVINLNFEQHTKQRGKDRVIFSESK